ncbi:MAG: FecR domain-containing protein [Alistipes sp.]|jgi:ferric-dicitrate binding protein FerR (iron transport regulator)|nr:FecR domain-containing protein [Alistipes sp.]
MNRKENLFYRYCAGTATAAERSEVESIIAGSPSEARELELVAEAVEVRRRIEQIPALDAGRGFRSVSAAISRRRRVSSLRRGVSRAAAILLLPLMVSTMLLGLKAFHKSHNEPVYVEVEAAPGSISRFELPDGSIVSLNAGATLRYPASFDGGVREVALDGEGYFAVVSDPEHPFYVSTSSGVKVMAYGTHFSVNSADGHVHAVLEDGHVRMLDPYRREIDIRPGEQVSWDAASEYISVGRVNLYEKLAWKDGKIVFRNAPMSDVFDRLSQRYNVDIVLHDEKGLSEKYSARVTFSDETIQQIFSYLEMAAPVKWRLSAPRQNTDTTLARQRIDVWLTE